VHGVGLLGWVIGAGRPLLCYCTRSAAVSVHGPLLSKEARALDEAAPPPRPPRATLPSPGGAATASGRATGRTVSRGAGRGCRGCRSVAARRPAARRAGGKQGGGRRRRAPGTARP